MDFAQMGVHILMGIFAVGVAGCLITIPLCAIKFFAVLVEHEHPEEHNGNSQA